jgi:adenylate cyclase
VTMPSDTVMLVIIGLQAAALVTVTVLWLHQRSRAASLAKRLAGGESRLLASSKATVKAVLDTAALVREKGVGGAIKSSIGDLAGWAEAERPDLRRLAASDGTVTIFFSDIEDSTPLNHKLGDRAWVKVLGKHDGIVRGRVDRHEGHIIKSQGDGFMIAFSHPPQAVRCAAEVQRALAADRGLRDVPIRVRIGIHCGQAVERNGDLFGLNVALAARVAAHAHGSQILVTPEVSEAVESEFELIPAGEVDLKGLAGTYRLHEVSWQA